MKIPNGVVCLISALAYHEITTQVPHEVYVALERGAEAPRLAHPPVRIFWFSGQAFTHGMDLCKNRGVRRLALFGSAATGSFDRSSSDLDLIVEFQPMSPVQHADNYFGLMEDLQKLFDLPVDLIELAPIRNPFFRQAVVETEEVLYERCRTSI
jgi:predicted nucleotidyltransferase